MNTDHIAYTPTEEESKKIGHRFWQLWFNLPDVQYELEDSRCGELGLKHDEDGNYIWVNPNAFKAYLEDESTHFAALVEPKPKGKICARYVKPEDSNIDFLIKDIERENYRLFGNRKARKYRVLSQKASTGKYRIEFFEHKRRVVIQHATQPVRLEIPVNFEYEGGLIAKTSIPYHIEDFEDIACDYRAKEFEQTNLLREKGYRGTQRGNFNKREMEYYLKFKSSSELMRIMHDFSILDFNIPEK
jgi:hypothetical protein